MLLQESCSREQIRYAQVTRLIVSNHQSGPQTRFNIVTRRNFISSTSAGRGTVTGKLVHGNFGQLEPNLPDFIVRAENFGPDSECNPTAANGGRARPQTTENCMSVRTKLTEILVRMLIVAGS